MATINVIQDDIDEAIRLRQEGEHYTPTQDCPIARAARRVFSRVDAVSKHGIITFDNGIFWLSVEAKTFVDDFDNEVYENVHPFSFEAFRADY